jgi:hypothetical protein
MTILNIIGVAFAALCVWLTVRIVNRRERWAKWTLAVMVGLPMLYVLSFGPACWWFSEPFEPKSYWKRVIHKGRVIHNLPVKVMPRAFTPLAWAAKSGPRPLISAVRWYATRRGDFVYCRPKEGSTDDPMLFSPP